MAADALRAVLLDAAPFFESVGHRGWKHNGIIVSGAERRRIIARWYAACREAGIEPPPVASIGPRDVEER